MKSILSALIGASLACGAIQANAEEPTLQKVQLDIARQSLTAALNAWAEQTGFQLICLSPEVARELTAPKVKGAFTATGALEQLLAGTPLMYEFTSERTVTVRARFTSASQTTGSVDRVDVPRLQIAALSMAEGERSTESAASTPKSNTRDRRAANESEDQSVDELEEIIVTGSRLRAATTESPAPVYIFTREHIEQLGVTNIADVLSYLPQQTFATKELSTFGGARTIQLRGLGVGTTLVLINGRRTVTSALQGTRNFFDVNTIPLNAVERVEVLSDSASAVYGADAVGGVVNIILKSDIDAPTLSAYYGTARGGGEERRASIGAGHAGSRLNVSVVADAYQRNFLLGSEREYFGNQDYTRFGSIDARLPAANPGNIFSLDGGNLPGLPAPNAAVPAGSTGIGLSPADFLATAGSTNLESFNRWISIVPEAERYSVFSTAGLQVADRVNAFGEFGYSKGRNTTQFFPSFIFFGAVPASNAFNPFGQDVGVNYLFSGMGPTEEVSRSEAYRGLVGVRGTFARGWDWELAMLGTRDRATSRILNSVDPLSIEAALASNDPDAALNVFQDGPGGSPQLLRSLLRTPVIDRFESKGTQVSALLRGQLFEIPAGAIEIALGAESRSEDLALDISTAEVDISPNRGSESVYSELRIPLVSTPMRVPLMSRLTLTIAGRYDRYDDFGSAFNPQYGLQWEPNQNLLLRASYGTSYRAPTLFELFSSVTTFDTVVIDVVRDNELAPVSITSGGNRDLNPEESASSNFGFVFSWPKAADLRFAANYWRISQSSRVQGFGAEVLLPNEQAFPGRIVRAAPSPQDVAAGLPGPLVSIDTTSINFGNLKTDGVDAQLSTTFNTSFGKVTAALSGTWVNEYQTVDLPNTPAADRVGIARFSGTIPRWRAVGSLAWTRGPFSASTVARHVPSYDDSFFDTPNGRTVAGQTLIDIQGSIDVGNIVGSSDWLRHAVIRAGLINAFDVEPEFSEVKLSGFDPSIGDATQRFGYVSFTLSF